MRLVLQRQTSRPSESSTIMSWVCPEGKLTSSFLLPVLLTTKSKRTAWLVPCVLTASVGVSAGPCDFVVRTFDNVSTARGRPHANARTPMLSNAKVIFPFIRGRRREGALGVLQKFEMCFPSTKVINIPTIRQIGSNR